MAHTVHTTSALVLSSADVQDADKLFWLFTEDLGLLFVSAKSVREEVSKLRYALQDLSVSRVSLVRGRGLWRLTGAEENGAPQLSIEKAEVFGRIATLARRLVPTDEKNPELFNILYDAREALIQGDANKGVIESIAVARMLYRLGYLSCSEEYRGVVDVLHFDDIIIEKGKKLDQQLVQSINTGLAESQL